MTQVLPKQTQTVIRSMQYRDWEAVERLHTAELEADLPSCSIDPDRSLKQLYPPRWNRLSRGVSLLLNPVRQSFGTFLAEREGKIRGLIRVSPFNRTRSTWRVDRVVVQSAASEAIAEEASPSAEAASLQRPLLSEVGSQLLRYCFESIWEARTWLLEVDINHKEELALYRQNGFQPLAHLTYWNLVPPLLQELAEREPDLPNLLPISNADAQLLYQLDTAAMPPLVRQVFDRHIFDFKTSLFGSLIQGMKNWLSHSEVVSGYVFESQRKAAIGYFQVRLSRDGTQTHQAQLTVHPAYTWLYPELLAQMARIAQEFPGLSLQLVSSDYQPEREEYLEHIGASRTAHTLMMSRSVWHKVRESKPIGEGLQLADVLQNLKPARKPIPSRITVANLEAATSSISSPTGDPTNINPAPRPATPPEPSCNGKSLLSPSDFSDPPQEGPCC
ncbi:MAG TPA: GNAT family N-acetyltransferase [Thermosynechococcaceae cyanobacterium]